METGVLGRGEKEPCVPHSEDDVSPGAVLAAVRAEIRSAVAANAHQKEASQTLRELAAEWLPRKLRSISEPRTFEGRVENWILPLLGDHTSASLRKRDVETFLLDLKQKHGLAPQTINHIRDAGRQLVEDAIDNEEWLGANPFAKAKQHRIPSKTQTRLSRAEAARLLRCLSPRWRPMFAVALYLGPRRKSIFSILLEDVDLEHGVIHFNDTKTDEPVRDVPIPSELLSHIKTALRLSRGPWLFTTRFGRRFSKNNKTIAAALARALKRAGIYAADGVSVRALTFRGLRRCSSTLHQEAGCHSWVVSRVLGHAQAALVLPETMTARKYTVFSQEFVRRELNKLSLR